jgi:hypothetical protein
MGTTGCIAVADGAVTKCGTEVAKSLTSNHRLGAGFQPD